MPFFKSLPEDAGPGNVFARYPDIFGRWAGMVSMIYAVPMKKWKKQDA